jgi:hypothetical protein
MSIFDEQEAKKPYVEGEYEQPPEGNHLAVLIAMVDLGTQRQEYNGEVTNYRKVYLAWELVEEEKEEGSPHVIGRDYTLSFAENAGLRKMMEKWMGKKIPPGEKPRMTALLGKSCMLSVAHTPSRDGTRHFAKVDLIAPLPKSVTPKPSTHKPFFWDMSIPGDPPDLSALPYLYGEPLVDWIKRSPEWAKRGEAVQQERERQTQASHQQAQRTKFAADVDEAIPVGAEEEGTDRGDLEDAPF